VGATHFSRHHYRNGYRFSDSTKRQVLNNNLNITNTKGVVL
jgi:hypothetical protein